MKFKFSERAFSFIEVIVAFGLLSIMVSIFFNLIPSSSLASMRAENRLTASTLAQNHLERLRSSPYDELSAKDGAVTTLTEGSTEFTLTTSVQDVTGIEPDHLKHVKVQVSWKEKLKDQSLEYELRVFNQQR